MDIPAVPKRRRPTKKKEERGKKRKRNPPLTVTYYTVPMNRPDAIGDPQYRVGRHQDSAMLVRKGLVNVAIVR